MSEYCDLKMFFLSCFHSLSFTKFLPFSFFSFFPFILSFVFLQLPFLPVSLVSSFYSCVPITNGCTLSNKTCISVQRSTDHTCLQVLLQGERRLLLLTDNDGLSCKVTGRHTCKSVLRLLLVTSRAQNWFETSSTDLFIRKQNLTGMKMRSL